MCILFILLFFALIRRKFRVESRNSKIREVLHVVLIVASFVDIVIALSRGRGLIISKYVRLIRITVSIRALREAIKRIILVIYDSKEILLLWM